MMLLVSANYPGLDSDRGYSLVSEYLPHILWSHQMIHRYGFVGHIKDANASREVGLVLHACRYIY